MKRSFLNARIREAIDFFAEHQFYLPPWAFFTPQEWTAYRNKAKGIFTPGLGWDVTSFGSDDFFRCGLLLFTMRNGVLDNPEYPKPYAEKIMVVRENQVTPLHFHWYKKEDIINRGGGNLVIELFRADPVAKKLAGGEFNIEVNGFTKKMISGEKLILAPGDSVCFESIHAHRFYGEPGSGTVLSGEVSMVNNDSTDNCFIDAQIRFDPIEEDEEARYLIVNDYKTV